MPTLPIEDFIFFLPTLWKGAQLTIFLTIVIFVLAVLLGLLVALGRLSRFRLIRIPLTIYVELVRSTPGLVQIYYIFYVLPFFGLTMDAIPAGIAGLSLNYAAYLSEVFRSGIQSVPVTQREGSDDDRAVAIPDPAIRHPSAGSANRPASDRQLPAHAVQGHVAAVRHHDSGTAVLGPSSGRDHLQAPHHPHRDSNHLLRHLLSGRASGYVSGEQAEKQAKANAAVVERVASARPSRTDPGMNYPDINAASPIVVLDDVHQGYDGTPVLQGINLNVDAGEVVAVIGPSGSGKSTLLRVICRLVPTTSGRVLVDGIPVHRCQA